MNASNSILQPILSRYLARIFHHAAIEAIIPPRVVVSKAVWTRTGPEIGQSTNFEHKTPLPPLFVNVPGTALKPIQGAKACAA